MLNPSVGICVVGVGVGGGEHRHFAVVVDWVTVGLVTVVLGNVVVVEVVVSTGTKIGRSYISLDQAYPGISVLNNGPHVRDFSKLKLKIMTTCVSIFDIYDGFE